MWFIRVDTSDDPRLFAVYQRINDGRKQVLTGLLIAMFPYLETQKEK